MEKIRQKLLKRELSPYREEEFFSDAVELVNHLAAANENADLPWEESRKKDVEKLYQSLKHIIPEQQNPVPLRSIAIRAEALFYETVGGGYNALGVRPLPTKAIYDWVDFGVNVFNKVNESLANIKCMEKEEMRLTQVTQEQEQEHQQPRGVTQKDRKFIFSGIMSGIAQGRGRPDIPRLYPSSSAPSISRFYPSSSAPAPTEQDDDSSMGLVIMSMAAAIAFGIILGKNSRD